MGKCGLRQFLVGHIGQGQTICVPLAMSKEQLKSSLGAEFLASGLVERVGQADGRAV